MKGIGKIKNFISEQFMKKWLVLELSLPKEYIDVVSNFLFEQGATGVEEIDGNNLFKNLRTYFLQNGKQRKILHSLRNYLKSLNEITQQTSSFQIKTTSLLEQDWAENWKRFFKPVQVTPRLLVKPPWANIQIKEGVMSIDIKPGMAFGTGTHATTILCIQALEKLLTKKRLSVIDVGTGSGILAIIAAKLGAKEVWGIDIDGVAIKNARENVEGNQLSNMVKIRKGRIGNFKKKFDLIVANIHFKSLMRMRKSLLTHLENKGFLIISGILEGEKERISQHFLKTGFLQPMKTTQMGEWVCLIFKRK